jgi:hypothetical protein
MSCWTASNPQHWQCLRHGAAIDVQPIDDIVDAVLHGISAGIHDILSSVGHRLDDRFNGIGYHGYAARHRVAEVF